MSTKDYYKHWLQLKNQLQQNLLEDQRIQDIALNSFGLKPQATAVEYVARVYAKYCQLYNSFCDCYDQMTQVQRRPYIKKIIDALTCRLIELKKILEDVEVFEFTYPDNALQQMLIQPQDIEIMCPFFYPFEMRQAEMQYIIDQIFEGNRIGDPPLTASQLELNEQARKEEEDRLAEEKAAEVKRLLALGYDIVSEQSAVITPEEKEAMRLKEEYERHLFNIQRMERSRFITRYLAHEKFKSENLYLELAGLKKPKPREDILKKAGEFIQNVLRRFMEIKRKNFRHLKEKEKLDMIIKSFKPPSAKVHLEKVKEIRRNFRRSYYEKWMAETIKEKARVLRLRQGDIMEDISDEIRQWFDEWFMNCHVFDEFPWPDEGGSILIVTGETFTIEEYMIWKEAEEKRLKAEAGKEKTKEQIKGEKKAAKAEKKRLALEAKEKERKRLIEYKKARLNPGNDPGVYLKVGTNLQPLQFAWASYECQWKSIDEPEELVGINALKGYLMQLITETAYHDVHIELRPLVDEFMRLELDMLKKALRVDYDKIGLKLPLVKKRTKPKKVKQPRPEKLTPEYMFQKLADQGIVRRYPHVTLDDYWGDRNYAAADCRAVLWTPTFPKPCIGDVKELIRTRCLLTIGAKCPGVSKTQLIVGPKRCGKKTLVYAVATETNAILIDLSPLTVYDKFLGPKATKQMFLYINKISRIMQPTIILVDKADKMFYKKVPPEEKVFNPTRFSKDIFKEIIKPLGTNDHILVLATATEPWLAVKAKMFKAFPNTIMIPRSDYGSISYVLKKMLMEYHAVDREFNVHSVAQCLRGYDINSIIKVIRTLVSGKRLAELNNRPLQPLEIVDAVIHSDATYLDPSGAELYDAWYLTYSPWGVKYTDYMTMLQSQYLFKLKADKKK